MNNIILVIVAHPDDEILGCGGSMAKWVKDGNEVHVLILAEGSTSRGKIRDRKDHKVELTHLSEAANEAGQIIGIDSINLMDYPDNRMDSVDLLDVIKTIEKYLEKIKPEVVLTHHFGDLNIDHRLVHEAVITACRPYPDHYVKRILTFEVPSATEWRSATINNLFVPNWFEDISLTLDLKVKALEAYHLEMREWPHPRSLKAVKHLARWRGSSIGCEAAEAFMLIREIIHK